MCSADQRGSTALRIIFTITMGMALLPMYPKRLAWMTRKIALDLPQCGQTLTTTGALTFLLPMMDRPTICTVTTAPDTLPTLLFWRVWPSTRMGAEQANMGLTLGDYQHTGLFSLAITHFSDEYTALFRNDGKLNFTDVSYASGIAPATTPYVGWGDAFFDFDNDGWPDLFLVNGHVYPQVDGLDITTKYREPGLLFLNQRAGTLKNLMNLVDPAIPNPHS